MIPDGLISVESIQEMTRELVPANTFECADTGLVGANSEVPEMKYWMRSLTIENDD
jgi:hypothetical protein